jgi:drug/metabolite transporter (DMT)-like permease
MPTGRAFDFAVLALGVVAVSTAAIFIREAEAPALIIAAYRLSIASLPLLLLAGLRRTNLAPGSREKLILTLLSGVFLALHFVFWVSSVKQTSIVTSVVLVTLAPLFVALASAPLLGERPGRATWAGLAIAAAGTLVMVSEDFGAGGDTLQGDAFALLGAVFAAAYFLAGRRMLAGGGAWLPYTTATYSLTAVILLAVALAAGDPFGGYSQATYLYFVLLALVPQLIGHTAVNRSLGHLPAIAVSLAVQGEPVGATILAATFLGEDPTALQLAGALLVLLGVYAGLRPEAGGAQSPLPDLGGESRPAEGG